MSALNSLTTSLLHFASSQLTRQGAKKMLESSKQLESIQRAKLLVVSNIMCRLTCRWKNSNSASLLPTMITGMT